MFGGERKRVAERWDEQALGLIRSYLKSGQASPELFSTGPLERSVPIYPSTWLRWFEGGPWADVAIGLVNTLPDCEERHGRARKSVNRAFLVSLSKLASDRDRDALIQLFVATMLWGSGTTNGRGPRNTSLALSDERLITTLETTFASIAGGDIEAAHQEFRVHGIGPSFFTKWFWSVGLSQRTRLAPLILDFRVQKALNRLTGERWLVRGRRASSHYMDYLRRADSWAAQIAKEASMSEIDAEKVEWMLFDRGGESRKCLVDWLPNG